MSAHEPPDQLKIPLRKTNWRRLLAFICLGLAVQGRLYTVQAHLFRDEPTVTWVTGGVFLFEFSLWLGAIYLLRRKRRWSTAVVASISTVFGVVLGWWLFTGFRIDVMARKAEGLILMNVVIACGLGAAFLVRSAPKVQDE